MIAQATAVVRFPFDLAVTTCFRVDPKGKIIDTQYRLVSRESTYAKRDREDGAARTNRNAAAATPSYERPSAYQDWSRDPWRATPQWDYGQHSRGQQRRADPNSFWNYQR